MILITGEARIKDGTREAMAEAARPMIAASLAEPGCGAYRYSFDLDDAHLMYFHEEWESDEALLAHFMTPHLVAFVQASGPLMAGRPTIIKSVVTESGPLG